MPAARSVAVALVAGVLLVALLITTHCPRTESMSLRAHVARLEDELAAVEPLRRRMASLEFLRDLGEIPPVHGTPAELEIIACSPLPDPQKAPYPDCVVVAEARLLGGGHGASGTRVLIGLLGFRERVAVLDPVPAPGARMRARLLRQEDVDDAVNSIQRSDTTDALELEFYYASEPRSIAADGGRIDVAANLRALPVLSRDEAIARDLARLKDGVAAHGGRYDRWHDALAPQREALAALGPPLTKHGRMTFRTIDNLAWRPDPDWPRPQVLMLASLGEQLARKGIDLIVVPVPLKELATAAHFLAPELVPADGVLDPHREHFLVALLDAGVETIDVLPALRAGWDDHELVYLPGQDIHIADGGVQIVARAIAERLRRYDLPCEHESVTTQRVLYPMPDAAAGVTCAATVVVGAGGAPVGDGREGSPVLLIGDSFIGVPESHGVASASIAAHLAKEIGVLPERFLKGGGAALMQRFLATAPAALFRDKRVCVFVFADNVIRKFDPDGGKFEWATVDIPALR